MAHEVRGWVRVELAQSNPTEDDNRRLRGALEELCAQFGNDVKSAVGDAPHIRPRWQLEVDGEVKGSGFAPGFFGADDPEGFAQVTEWMSAFMRECGLPEDVIQRSIRENFEFLDAVGSEEKIREFERRRMREWGYSEEWIDWHFRIVDQGEDTEEEPPPWR